MKQLSLDLVFPLPAVIIDEALTSDVVAKMTSYIETKKPRLILHALVHPSTMTKTMPDIQNRETWDPAILKDVAVNKRRMKTLLRQSKCVCCGRESNVFVVEEVTNCSNPKYLNLYSVNEHNVMEMTVDHILVQSLGGNDTQTNRVTMCFDCNQKKANTMSAAEIDLVLSNVRKYTKEHLPVPFMVAVLTLMKLSLNMKGNDRRQVDAMIKRASSIMHMNTKKATFDRHTKDIQTKIASLTQPKPPVAPVPVVVKSGWLYTIMNKLIGLTRKLR